MSIFGIKTSRFISADVGVMVVPILLVIILVAMSIFSFKFAYPKIASQISELEKAEDQLTALEQKLSILRQVEDKILGAADTSLIALPNENPGIWKLSQIALLAEDNEVLIDHRKVTSEAQVKNNMQSTKITFAINGSFDKTLAFLNSLVESVPIITLGSVNIGNGGENTNAKVELFVYRAELPTLLPAITAPIKNLSDKEQELLNTLENLSRPEFTFLEPSGPYERIDPFN